ncbi:MAG: hypothetical protein KGY69_06895 [Bacteroidales bacterium]|nr:hypothetical protein [Bacteroidales bacterium]
MNAIKKVLTLTIIGSVLIFAGCEDDDTVSVMDKEEAITTLEQNDQELKTSLEDIENTKGMQAMQTLNGITEENDPFSDQKASGYETVLENLQEVLKPVNENHLKRSAEQKFDFDKWVGTYTWEGPKEWNIQLEEPDDAIVIEFPTDTTEEPIENNAVLTLSDYSEFETTDSLGNTVYVPNTVVANLTVDDEEVLTIDYTLEYDSDNEMVTSLSADVYLKPFTWSLSMTQNSIEASLTNENTGNVLTSFAFEVTFTDDNMEDVEKLDGHVQLHKLNLQGWIKPSKIEKVEDQDTWADQGWESIDDVIEYVNEQIDISLYHINGNKIADLKIIKNDTDKEQLVEVVLVFKDDSTEPAKDYFQKVIEYIKSVMAKYNLEEPEV